MGPSQQHTMLNRVYVHGGMHGFALNDLPKRSLGAADLGIWSVSTLHSFSAHHRQSIYNSYTIWPNTFKFKPHSLSLILILRSPKWKVNTQSC